MQLTQNQVDDEPELIGQVTDDDLLLQQAWKHIPLKAYLIRTSSDKILHRKILYINPEPENLSLSVESTMPNILQINTPSLLLSKDVGMYIKFQLILPKTNCTLYPKIVLWNVQKQLPHEGMEFTIVVNDIYK